MTADVQRELAEVIDRHAARGTTVPDLAAALLPTVQTLIADAEKRAAAGALRDAAAEVAVARLGQYASKAARLLLARAAALDPSGAAEGAGR